MKAFRSYLLMMLMALTLGACDVHEFPRELEPEPPQRVATITLHFSPEIPLWQELQHDESKVNAPTRTGDVQLERRYIILAYPMVKGEFSRDAADGWTFYGPAEADPDTTFTIQIPEGEFRLLAWSDLTETGKRADRHYDTTDFNEIILADKENYSGSDDSRDAFRGESRIARDDSQCTVPMIRPLAKFRFVTTDLDKFISQETRRSGINSRDDTRRPDLMDNYIVRFVYPRYMPCSFNMFTNRPADSWTGMFYDSDIRSIDEATAEIGFDYVFVNTHDTSVNVAIEVYDRDSGTLLARINPIDVPLRRSHLTVVTGPFLTTRAEGGAGINPDYDGEFNIEIK